jgi:hypothetical protein
MPTRSSTVAYKERRQIIECVAREVVGDLEFGSPRIDEANGERGVLGHTVHMEFLCCTDELARASGGLLACPKRMAAEGATACRDRGAV